MLHFTLLDKSFKSEEKRERFMTNTLFLELLPSNEMMSLLAKSCDLEHDFKGQVAPMEQGGLEFRRYKLTEWFYTQTK